MAFLAPFLAPVLGGLATGAAAATGGYLANKIIGDAPPEDPTAQSQQQQLALQGTQEMSGQANPGYTSQMQLNPYPSSSHSQPWITSPPSNYPMQLPTNPNSSQNAMSAAQSANILGQSASDGAALLANGQSHLQEIKAIREGMMQPTPHGASYLIQQGLSSSVPNTIPAYMGTALNAVPARSQGVSNTNVNAGTSTPMPISNTTMIPSDGILRDYSVIQTAPQPTFKTFANQGINIPTNDNVSINNPVAASNSNPFSVANNIRLAGREIAHGALSGATGALNQVASNAGTQAMNLASQVVTRGAARAGSALQTAIGGLIKKIIGDAPPLEQPPAWANDLINGNLRMDPQVLKIIGDALPNTISRFAGFTSDGQGNSAVKVVGDAPPLDGQPGFMTSEQMNAAQNNLAASCMFQLMAKIILQEQLLETASGFVLGLDVRQMNKAYGALMSIVSGSFDQSATRVVNGIQGCTMIMQSNCFWSWNVETNSLEWVTTVFGFNGSVEVRGITACELASAKVSPPLGGNTTLETLKPLLLGAATTEYSGQLRVATSLTNIDSMMRTVAVVSNQIASQSGYSFALPLIKALGYLLGFNPLLGENLAAFHPAYNATFTNNWAPGVFDPGNLNTGWQPMSGIFPLQTEESDWETGDVRNIKISVLTERDFSLHISSGLTDSTWNEAFHIANWGTSCAVVYVPPGSTNNGYGNLVRMLCQMGYPFCVYGPPSGGYTNYANMYDAPSDSFRVGALPFNTGNAMPGNLVKPFLTRIPGPMRAVLFVVLGNYERVSTPYVMLQGFNRKWVVNGEENSPSEPFLLDIRSPDIPDSDGEDLVKFLSSVNFQPALLAYLREWESFFGNNSDRASALRFWADHSRLYGFKAKVASDIEVGTPQIIVCPPVLLTLVEAPPPGLLPNITGMPDLPLHLTSNTAALTGREDFDLSSLCVTTATGLLTYAGAKETHNVQVGDVVYFSLRIDTTYLNSCTIVPAQDYLIDYLVYRKWVYPLEEYPTTLLSDAARISMTVAIMSNMLAAGTDAIYQANSMGVTPFYIPTAISSVETITMLLSRQVWPTVESMINMGIQFPSVYNIRDSLMFYTVPSRVAAVYNDHLTPNLTNGTAFSSIARIPREVMGQWVPSLMPIWNRLRLNVPVMKPSRAYVTIGNANYSLFSIMVSTDDTGLTPAGQTILNSLLSRVSQGVVALGLSRNVGFVAHNTRNGRPRPYFFSFRYYNEYRDQLIVAAMGGATSVIPAFTNLGLPVVEALCTRDYVFGFDPIRFLSSGPTDAFGPGDGSYSYIMYYNMAGGFSTITTNSHATVPDSVFTGDGMTNFLNFL